MSEKLQYPRILHKGPAHARQTLRVETPEEHAKHAKKGWNDTPAAWPDRDADDEPVIEGGPVDAPPASAPTSPKRSVPKAKKAKKPASE